jgi:hypothetical protein
MGLISDHSETGIANEALSAAQVPSILSDLDQKNSKAARVCKLHLPAVRDELLRAHGFSFSRAQEIVGEKLPAPLGGSFGKAFSWPTDGLRIVSIDGLTKRQWRPETGARILASASGPLTVHFIKRIMLFPQWDALARRLMVLTLATRIAPELTRTRAVRADLQEELQMLLREAPKIDAYEQDSEQDDTDDAAWVPGFIAVRA